MTKFGIVLVLGLGAVFGSVWAGEGEEEHVDMSRCCTKILVDSSGRSLQFQSRRIGEFHLNGVVADKPIYKHVERDEFIFYLVSKYKGVWMVGPKPGHYNGGLAHIGDSMCVENAAPAQWKFTNGSVWQVDELLTVACIDAEHETECLYEENREFVGGDLPQEFGGQGLVTSPTSSAECISECEKRAMCKYWTWVQGTAPGDKNCYLKMERKGSVMRNTYVSGSDPAACAGKGNTKFDQFHAFVDGAEDATEVYDDLGGEEEVEEEKEMVEEGNSAEVEEESETVQTTTVTSEDGTTIIVATVTENEELISVTTEETVLATDIAEEEPTHTPDADATESHAAASDGETEVLVKSEEEEEEVTETGTESAQEDTEAEANAATTQSAEDGGMEHADSEETTTAAVVVEHSGEDAEHSVDGGEEEQVAEQENVTEAGEEAVTTEAEGNAAEEETTAGDESSGAETTAATGDESATEVEGAQADMETTTLA